MTRRKYQMDRRAESAGETRDRIVRATYELHTRNGIAATSVRDIAARAEVAVGTVYHHFPTYDDVVNACGAYTAELTQPPGVEILAGVDAPAARLQAVVEAVFSFYRRFPGFERVRADREKFEQVERFLRADEINRRELLTTALQPKKVNKQALAVAFALLDVAVFRALRANGLSHADAVREITNLVVHCLIGAGSIPVPARKRTAANRP